MRLTKVQIKGYRSFKAKTTILLDNHITVLLGANDHGKTNFLSALEHLNVDHPFEEERDLNWDEDADSGEFPSITYTLKPESGEKAGISVALTFQRRIDVVMDKLSALNDQRNGIESEIQHLKAALESAEAEEPEETSNGGEGETKQIPPDAAVSKLHQSKKVELATLEEMIELWERAREVLSVASKGDLSQKVADTAIANLKRSLVSSDAELKKANERKASTSDALAAAQSNGSATGVDQAKKTLRDIDAHISRWLKESARLRQSISRLEKHVESQKSKTNKEYLEIINQIGLLKADCPETFDLVRSGVGGKLEFVQGVVTEPLPQFLKPFLPKVQIFSSVERLPDEVNKDSILSDENLFMRGIFYYAGLEKNHWAKAFSQNDHTSKQLEDASVSLNEVLRRDWRQGRELEFKLQHRGNAKINLVISDPKVKRRYVRVSRRSSGFAHFFGLKTMLHAYEQEAPSASYIWMFDEPGMSLHPDGQHDLLQALDTISKQNQVIYTTHSLFMIDKNYPARHRLLAKANEGTRVDGKPFLGNWRAAIDALGLALPGTILFATHVLLVEGASDAIFLNALLQRMAEEGMHDLDINPLSIMPAGDSKEADAVARILMEASMRPRVAALYDGDDGGKRRKAKLDKVLEKDAHVVLEKQKTIEDYLPGFEDLFVPIAAAYGARVFGGDKKEIIAEITAALKEAGKDEKRVDVVLGAIKKAAKLDEAPSKVGIARDYAHALLGAEHKISKEEGDQLKKLVAMLQGALNLPTRTTAQDRILQ
ncbi:hypothetical protein Plav_1680 [Parvibaculum lavamentivorans DS-1]|uniref:Uncharacterized protein n=1 Tax=Parvibaculum lavamentivorans (strain DS-1 / DSM 13023 / NCIMB 13966) TaxID=402881 RepID=A7HTR6_PARL1|nr:AAA family ATPase [Parvibaculum lavamentivorans]ABS63299.1 hypothetical protein Plav_1680 [Parvibaculum lavamentivorans DS-1]